jgi:hypothetical protein
MSLRFATEPKNGTALVQKGLNKLAKRSSPLGSTGAAAVDFSALQVNSPHAVYDLRADLVASGGGLASAHATGFRYLIQGGGTHVAAAEVTADATGAATLVTHMNYGPYVQATADALTKVAALAAVSAGSYEVRLLRCSAISLMALWLKSDAGGADIIFPLPPAPPGLLAEQSYSANDFIKAILPLAQKRSAKKQPGSLP